MLRNAVLFVFAMLVCAAAPAQDAKLATATFAGGCFWCMEEALDKVPGVVSTTSGYIGGNKKNPTYEEVSSGRTGHTEAVQVKYDPAKVSYERLLQQFWLNHDPTMLDGQFCDHGSQYKPAIFWHDEEQKRLAEASKAKWEKEKPFKQAIVTPILKASEFWPPRSITRTITRRTRSATSSTPTAAAAIRGSTSSGASCARSRRG
jgi:peptide-methionine (S)-S-oxide reductase